MPSPTTTHPTHNAMENIPDPGFTDTGSLTQGKADPAKRFGALLIDFLIGGVILAVLGQAIELWLGLFALSAYILLRDGLSLEFMDGRSIGKKLLKLRIVREDGRAMDMQASIMRNWPLAIGFIVCAFIKLGGPGPWERFGWLGMLASLFVLVECILVLTDANGRRFGDKFAKTQVVDSVD